MARWTGPEDAKHLPSKHMLNVKEHENNTGEPQAQIVKRMTLWGNRQVRMYFDAPCTTHMLEYHTLPLAQTLEHHYRAKNDQRRTNT